MLYFKRTRFARFDNESVNRGLPVLSQPEVSILGADLTNVIKTWNTG